MKTIVAVICTLLMASASAFVPSPQSTAFGGATSTLNKPARSTLSFTGPLEPQLPAALQRQRKSMASVQTMGLFGLGPAEIAIVLVAAAFLLGPQKLAELGKDAGKIAGELKEVPKEFQAGLQEGELEAAKAKKKMEAKIAEATKDDDKQ